MHPLPQNRNQIKTNGLSQMDLSSRYWSQSKIIEMIKVNSEGSILFVMLRWQYYDVAGIISCHVVNICRYGILGPAKQQTSGTEVGWPAAGYTNRVSGVCGEEEGVVAEDVQLVPPPPQPRDLNFLLVQCSQPGILMIFQRKLDSAKLV